VVLHKWYSKTKLLDTLLAGRKNSGKVLGNITFNGKSPKQSDYHLYIGYVEELCLHYWYWQYYGH